MISRLLLVGMVGVLGLSLPDGAEWGTALTWARTGTTACTGRRDAVVAFEPIAVDEEPNYRIADELNQRSEGVDITSTPIVSVAMRRRHAFAPVPSGDSIDLKLVAEFCRIAEKSEARATDAPRSIPGPVATEADDTVDRLFAENQVWGDPATGAMASNIPPARQQAPTFEPMAVAERVTDLAELLNRAAEGIDSTPTEAAAPSLPRTSFEPIAVADDASSLADDLNRASEGRIVEPETDRGIGDAIRLTRNAALAWMNVLTRTMPTLTASR